jgi:gluconolactonase
MGKMQGTGMLLALALTACSPAPSPAPTAETPPPAAAPAPPAPTVITDARIDRWDEAAMAAIVPADWKIEKLAEGFGWAEGPVWIASGNYLLFTDVPGNKMWKWSEASGLEIFLDPSGAASVDTNVWREAGANGLALDVDGTILMADTGNRAIQRLNLETKVKTPAATSFDGKKFSSPNDVVRMKSGVFFFSDPPYGFKKFDDAPEKEMPFNGVYRVATDGTVSVVDKELHRPNGVALSPDESVLYVAQSEPTKAILMAYSLDKDGKVTGKKLFHDATDLVAKDAPGLPDGIAIAADGTVFTTAPGGVLILSKEGKRLGRISDGKPTANAKFGDDGKTLYLTSQHMLARIRLNIAGAGFEQK